MKKLLILLVTVSLLFSCLAFTASAAEEADTACYAGDTITVTYYLPGAFGDISAGSIAFTHDETAFELVEAKWELQNLFIKDVNAEKMQGVFAFKTPKGISGKIFTATYLVKKDAEAGLYEFSADLQLQDSASSNQFFTLAKTVEIIERNENDEYTVEVFSNMVHTIDPAMSENALVSITEALEVYNALTEDEKAEAQRDYELLLNRINDYNEQASTHNQIARSTITVAFGTVSRAFTFLSELVTLIVRTIFKK